MRIPASRRRPRLSLAVGALAVVVLAACGSGGGGKSAASPAPAADALLGPAKAATGTTVKIGWDSTGQTPAVDTTNEIKAAQAVVAYANAYLGGIGGHRIQLVTCEDKSIPADAQACGNLFVSQKVVAVAGGSPGQTGPWIKIVAPAGIPVGLALDSDAVTLGTKNVFVWDNPLAVFGTPAAYARANKLKSAAVFVIDVPAASGPAKTLEPAFFGNAGGTADVIAVPPGTADMTPQVQTAQDKKPEMYYVLGDPTFCSSAIKAMKNLGVTQPIVAFARCIGTDKGASIPGGYSKIKIVTQADTAPTDAEYKLFSAVITTYGKNLPLDGNSVSGYQGMLGLIRAVNAGGTTDITPAGITAALKSMPATALPLGGGSTYQCDGKAIPAISPNICSSTGLTADASSDGTLSNFATIDATGIYKLGGG